MPCEASSSLPSPLTKECTSSPKLRFTQALGHRSCHRELLWPCSEGLMIAWRNSMAAGKRWMCPKRPPKKSRVKAWPASATP